MYYFNFSASFLSELSSSYPEDGEDFIEYFEVSGSNEFFEEETVKLYPSSEGVLFSTESTNLYFRYHLLEGCKVYQTAIRYSGTSYNRSISAATTELYPSSALSGWKSYISTDESNPTDCTVISNCKYMFYDITYIDINPITGSTSTNRFQFCPKIQDRLMIKLVSSQYDDLKYESSPTSTIIDAYLRVGWSEDSSDTVSRYSPGDTIKTRYSNITLYAIYQPYYFDSSNYDIVYTKEGESYNISCRNGYIFFRAESFTDGSVSKYPYWYNAKPFPKTTDKYTGSGRYYIGAPGSYSQGSTWKEYGGNSSNTFFHRISYTYANASSPVYNNTGYNINFFPPDPEVEGYACIGWTKTKNDASTKVELGDVVTTSSNALYLYSLFDVKDGTTTITISFFPNEGMTIKSITTTKGSKVTIPNEHPTGVGCFVGWGTKTCYDVETDYVAEYLPGHSYTFTESVTLHAVWARPCSAKGFVNYVEQGIELIDGTMEPTITGLPDGVFILPTADQYIYGVLLNNKWGYYTVGYGEENLFLAKHLTGDFSPIYYGPRSIKGAILENEIEISEVNVKQCFSSDIWDPAAEWRFGDAYSTIEIGINKELLKESNMEFYGWFTGATTDWSTGDGEATNAHLVQSDTLTAECTNNGFHPTKGIYCCPLVRYIHIKVIFDPQGGTVSPSVLEFLYGGVFSGLPTPIKGTAEFQGWYTDVESGTQIKDGDTVTQKEDTVLYARWSGTSSTIKVVFDPNGGTCATNYKEVQFGEPYGDLPDASKTSCTFLGWYTRTIGGSKIESTTTVSNKLSHYVYAQWEEPTYTITLDANGGSVSPTSITISNGQAYGALPTPQYSGYTTEGWFTAKEGGTAVKPEDKPTSSHTLYARWKTNSANWGYVKYRIYFETNGGTISESYGESKYTYGYSKELPTESEIEKSGFSFGGWYSDSELTIGPITQITASDKGSKRFYAKWV